MQEPNLLLVKDVKLTNNIYIYMNICINKYSRPLQPYTWLTSLVTAIISFLDIRLQRKIVICGKQKSHILPT